MADENVNDDNRVDPYGPRDPEPDDGSVRLHYPSMEDVPISYNEEEAADRWADQHGPDAEANKEAAIFLMKNFGTEEQIAELTDERQLAFDVQLGNDLLDIYRSAMRDAEESEKWSGLYTSMPTGMTDRQRADIKQRIGAAVMNAKARHTARAAQFSNRYK